MSIVVAYCMCVYNMYMCCIQDLEKSTPTVASLQDFQSRMNALRSATLDDSRLRNAVHQFKQQHWETVAANMKILPYGAGGAADLSAAAGSSRSGDECKRHWEAHCSEGALRGWTAAELQQLRYVCIIALYALHALYALSIPDKPIMGWLDSINQKANE